MVFSPLHTATHARSDCWWDSSHGSRSSNTARNWKGTEHLDDYRSLLKFGLVVDVSAALLSYLVAIGFALLFGPLVGIGEDTIKQVIIYSTVLLFQINGLPTAILRLAGRFRLMAYGSIVGGVVRLVLCFAGLLAGAGLLYFVVVWTVSQVFGSVVALGLALLEIRRQGMRRLISAPAQGCDEALQRAC